MTDTEREIKRLISYIRSCRVANIDCTVTIDKSLTHGVLNALEEIQQYREIGTVEECREAREKQKPMAIKEIHVDEYFCPCCGSENCCEQKNVGDKFCPNCGQALDGGEKE